MSGIYIAGPMRGHKDLNRAAFMECARDVKRAFPAFTIFNPGEEEARESLREDLAADFAFLAQADFIVFLPGWQGSEGARLEYGLARALNLGYMLWDGLEVSDPSFDWAAIAPVEDQAWRLVYGDRGTTYGHPSDNFARIAGLWSAQFGWTCSAADVAVAMQLFKIARKAGSYKQDNDVDQIGYVVAGQRMVNGT